MFFCGADYSIVDGHDVIIVFGSKSKDYGVLEFFQGFRLPWTIASRTHREQRGQPYLLQWVLNYFNNIVASVFDP